MGFRKLKSPLLVAVIVAISAFGARAESEPPDLSALIPTDPPVQVPEGMFYENGTELRHLSDYHGELVVLNFWATWCAPCVKEMPALANLRIDQADKGITVLPVSLDRGGARVVKAFYEKLNLVELPVLTDAKSTLAKSFGITGLPTTIIIDPKGQEVARLMGVLEWDHPATVARLRRYMTQTVQN
ncbi:MAG: TlpA disulfide reductase family protein [Magnetospiraceae bacterium]